MSSCIGYAARHAQSAALSASVGGGHCCKGVLVINDGQLCAGNRFPQPPPPLPNGLVFAAVLVRTGAGWEITVL